MNWLGFFLVVRMVWCDFLMCLCFVFGISVSVCWYVFGLFGGRLLVNCLNVSTWLGVSLGGCVLLCV